LAHAQRMFALLLRLWALKKVWNLIRGHRNDRNRQPNRYQPKTYEPKRYQASGSR